MVLFKNNIDNSLDFKVINNIKTLALDMINSAGSGHPGVVLSAAPIIYTLYAKHLKFDQTNPKWINRDRFVLSCGHASALLYSTLFMSGFDLKVEDLQNFRQLNAITSGHPEISTIGVDMTTGPLGQGFASSVGMAIAESFLNKRYHTRNGSIINHYIYCLVSDGDLMEGISYEAAAIAGNLELGRLIVLYDSNSMTLDNTTKETFKENVLDRFKAMGWDTYKVNDGNDINAIDAAITKAKDVVNKPSIIEIKTIIGEGSTLENTNTIHGKPLSESDLINLKKKLNIREVPYTVSFDAFRHINEQITKRNKPYIDKFKKLLLNQNDYIDEINSLINHDYKIEVNLNIQNKEVENKEMRDVNHIVINNIVKDKNLFLSGSSDVATSTRVYFDKYDDYSSSNRLGRNISFGVREHAMGAIANGIALLGIRCIVSTFLSFSDYLKPAIRMSALMNLPVIYTFTHDTIEVGEDGPTHQPIEQLVALRSIPNLVVYRPYDINEIIGTYKDILINNHPSAVIISKQKVKVLQKTNIKDVAKGAYIVNDNKDYEGIIISSGKELEYAIKVSDRLKEYGINTRVVSMVSLELFEKQSKKYQEKILPNNKIKIVIEFSSSYSWYKYTDKLICLDAFGKSGKKADLLSELKLDIDSLYEKVKKYLE